MKPINKNMGLAILVAAVAVSGVSMFSMVETDQTENVDSGSVMGHVTATVLDENGNIIAYSQSDNQIVTNGMEILADQTFSGTGLATTGPVSHMSVGTGAGPATPTDTGITEDLAVCPRVPATFSSTGAIDDAGSAAIVVRASATFNGDTCTLATDITEAGLFNDLSVGEMFANNAIAPVPPLGPNDSLIVDWDLTFTDT